MPAGGYDHHQDHFQPIFCLKFYAVPLVQKRQPLKILQIEVTYLVPSVQSERSVSMSEYNTYTNRKGERSCRECHPLESITQLVK